MTDLAKSRQSPDNAALALSSDSHSESEGSTAADAENDRSPINMTSEKSGGVGGDSVVTGSRDDKAILVDAETATATPAGPVEPPNPPHWKANLFLLVFAFFLGYNVQFMHFGGTVALAREMGGEAVATIPNALIFIGALISTMPISILGEKKGLKVSYLVGTAAGLIGGTLCIGAILLWSYPMLCIALLFQGTMAATTALVRFGVGSIVPKKYLSKSVSLIVAGAALAAPVGPQLTIASKNMIPQYPYLGIYIVIDALILLMAFTCMFLRFPPKPVQQPPASSSDPAGTPTTPAEPPQSRWSIVSNFLRSKRFLSATVAGMVSYAVMVLMMAPAPLAILGAGYSFADQANVLMAHTLGMFVPSLFSGFLIDRFGPMTMNIVGMVILCVAIGILFIGKIMWVFYVGECLIGVGWNFSYIAASTIILKMAKPGRELQTIQGINDTAIQALMAIIFLISAPLYRAVNWNVIAAISMALMGLAALTMLAIFRLPMKGMRDDFVGRKGYVRQPKDAEIGETGVKEEVEMENK